MDLIFVRCAIGNDCGLQRIHGQRQQHAAAHHRGMHRLVQQFRREHRPHEKMMTLAGDDDHVNDYR